MKDLEKSIAEEKKVEAYKEPVPYIVHEGTVVKLVQIIHRLIIVIVILLAMIAYGFYEFTSYDYSDVTVDSQGGGNANYMGAGASGVISNGEGGSQD